MLMNIFYRFLLIVKSLYIFGCTSIPGAPGFQKEYPWTFVPYTGAPKIYDVSFNDFIDLGPLVLQNQIKRNRQEQDKRYGFPVNALSENLQLYK